MEPRKAIPAMLAGLCAALLSVQPAMADFKDGEVIVKYQSGATRDRASTRELYERSGVASVRYFGGDMSDYEQLVLKEGVSVEDAIHALELDSAVEYAQPNYTLSIPEKATDFSRVVQKDDPALPCIPGMDIPGCDPNLCWLPGLPMPPGCTDWSLPGNPTDPGTPTNKPPLQDAPAEVIPAVADPDLSKAYGITKIGSDKVWPTHRGSKSFVVAVIDTGIDYNHEDLSFNVWRNPNPTQGDVTGYDFVHGDGVPFDDQGHGSHTSGTIGAVGGNGKGVSGVNQFVSIMGVKFLSAQGSGSTADAIRAIDYAIDHGARVLSNSWGGSGDDGNQALYDSIERAKAKDVLFVAAAGNESVDNDTSAKKSFPAAFDNDNLISVAATDSNDRMASFSNYGKVTTDLAAPGVNVHSLVPGGTYTAHSGTSMACPHVAGAAALVWSKNPSLTYKQVKDILLGTVDKVSGLESKVATGGRLNVAKAIRSME